MKLHQSFEDYLKDQHAADYIGTDDAMPDAFDHWLTELDIESMLAYGDQYGELRELRATPADPTTTNLKN